MKIDTGIMAIQKTVSQPLTRRIKTGSPCTCAQSDLATFIAAELSPRRERRNVAFALKGRRRQIEERGGRPSPPLVLPWIRIADAVAPRHRFPPVRPLTVRTGRKRF